jgi:hypothetical protein
MIDIISDYTYAIEAPQIDNWNWCFFTTPPVASRFDKCFIVLAGAKATFACDLLVLDSTKVKIIFGAGLHKISDDGLDVIFKLKNRAGGVITRKQHIKSYDPMKPYNEFTFSASELSEELTEVSIECFPGPEGNAEGDWLAIYQFIIGTEEELYQYETKKRYDDFKVELCEVNISTMDLCTRQCKYCKYGQTGNVKKAPRIMSTSLFEKILYDLKNINYNGIISPYEGNEPLLDSRIFEFVKMINQLLPEAKSFIYSNGDLATMDTMRILFENGLGMVSFSLHDKRNEDRIREIQKCFGEKKVKIANEYQMDKRNLFHNFAGLIESDMVSQTRYPNRGCYLPFRQLIVNPDGFIDLCCADIADTCVFQNAKENSVVDIFYNDPQLNLYRQVLSEEKREGLLPCSECSFVGYVPKTKLD